MFLSLFRGINVSGKNTIRMEALRSAMEAAGFTNVKTYIQSGNVVFESKLRSAAKVSQALEQLVKKEFGHEITIITLSGKELTEAIDNHPFAGKREPEQESFKKLHVLFLAEEPAAENFQKLQQAPIGNDQVALSGNVLYIRFETKQSDSKLSNSLAESKLKVRGTMRNWNTLLKLEEMLSR